MLKFLKSLGSCIGLFFLSQLGAVFVVLQVKLGNGFSLSHTLLLTSIMVAFCWATMVFAYVKGWLSLSWDFVTQKNMKLLLLSYPMVYAASMLGVIVMELQGAVEMTNQASLESLFLEIPLLLTIMMVSVSAPIMEEILCRAAIPSLFPSRYSKIGLLIGSLVFAWLHGPEHLGAWIIYGGMGLVFAWLKYKTGRLEMAIAGHMLWNSVALLLSFLFPS